MLTSEPYAVDVGSGRPSLVVGAAGMVWPRHRRGMLLQRLRAAPSAAAIAECRADLARALNSAVRRGDVRRHGRDCCDLADEALAWWLAHSCVRCGGVGWLVQSGGPRMRCGVCHGSASDPLAHEACRWIVARVEKAVAEAEAAHRMSMG